MNSYKLVVQDKEKRNQKYVNSQSRIYYNDAKKTALVIGSKNTLRDLYFQLAYIDSTTGNYKEAYEDHKRFVLYRDSLDNEETRKQTIQSQMTYDFDKI